MALLDQTIEYQGNNESPYTKFNEDRIDLNMIIESHLNEVVALYGHDTLYVKIDDITPDKIDRIFGEMREYRYSSAIRIRMYVGNGVEFGQNHQYTSMGLILKDEMETFIGIRQMDAILGRKPIVGDIVYYPHAKRFFRVNYVMYDQLHYIGKEPIQYQLKLVEFIVTEDFSINTSEIVVNRIGELEDLTNIPTPVDDVVDLIDKSERDPFGYGL